MISGVPPIFKWGNNFEHLLLDFNFIFSYLGNSFYKVGEYFCSPTLYSAMTHSWNSHFSNFFIIIFFQCLCLRHSKFLNFFFHYIIQNMCINVLYNADTRMSHQPLDNLRFHFFSKYLVANVCRKLCGCVKYRTKKILFFSAEDYLTLPSGSPSTFIIFW